MIIISMRHIKVIETEVALTSTTSSERNHCLIGSQASYALLGQHLTSETKLSRCFEIVRWFFKIATDEEQTRYLLCVMFIIVLTLEKMHR